MEQLSLFPEQDKKYRIIKEFGHITDPWGVTSFFVEIIKSNISKATADKLLKSLSKYGKSVIYKIEPL